MASDETKMEPISHDHNFKNLLLDFPEESLDFFFPKAKELWGEVKAVDLPRQETKKRRLKDGHLALDMPILFHFETEDVLLWMVEFQENKSEFSIYKIGIYTLEMMEEYPDAIVIPTVLFTDSKKWSKDVIRTLNTNLGDHNFFHFEYIFVHLSEKKALDHLSSENPVVRILLPKMQYEKEIREQVINEAYKGLHKISNTNLIEKYADFIDLYAEISEDEKEWIIKNLTEDKETVMIAQHLKKLGREEGKKEGKVEEKKEIAKNLLDILDIETIALKTGLSVAEVKALSPSKA